MSSRDRALAFVASFIGLHGYAPTVREISAGIDLSVSATYYHLEALKADGELAWEPGKQRTLRVVA